MTKLIKAVTVQKESPPLEAKGDKQVPFHEGLLLSQAPLQLLHPLVAATMAFSVKLFEMLLLKGGSARLSRQV